MINIFIAGEAGSGKDTVADYFIEMHGYLRAKVAYPVYAIARNYFNMTDKDRKLLQFIGTEAGRLGVTNDLWIDRLLEDLEIVRITSRWLVKPTPSFVLTDVRFKNEFEKLVDKGFLGFYLEVPQEERKKRLQERDGSVPEGFGSHYSEIAINEFKDLLTCIDGSQSKQEVIEDIQSVVFNKLSGTVSNAIYLDDGWE